MRRRAGSSPTSPGWIRGATSGLKQALAHVVSKKDEKQQAEAESLGMYTPGFCEKRAKVAVHLGELRKCEKVLTSWVATIESMRRTAGLMCAENMGDDIQGLGGNLDENVCSLRVLEIFQKAVRLVKEKTDLVYKLLRNIAELDKRLLHREKLKNKVEQSARKLANKGKSFSTDDVPFTRDLDLAKENFESHSKVVSDILDFISVESRRGFAYRENVFVRQYCEATFKNMGSENVDLSESMQRMEAYIEDFWTRQANFKNERQRERQLDKAYSTTFTGSRSRPQPFTDNAAAVSMRALPSSYEREGAIASTRAMYSTDNAPAVSLSTFSRISEETLPSAASTAAFTTASTADEDAESLPSAYPLRSEQYTEPSAHDMSPYHQAPNSTRAAHASSASSSSASSSCSGDSQPEEPGLCTPTFESEQDDGAAPKMQTDHSSRQLAHASSTAAKQPLAQTDVPNASSTGSNAHDARRFVPDGDDDPLPLRPKAGRKIPAWDTNKSSRKWMGGVTMNLGFPINEKDGWREYVSRDSGESFWVRLEDGHFQEKDPWKEGVVEDAASS